MKYWSDLSWKEKKDIENGRVNKYRYLTGYSFEVKTQVLKNKKLNNKEN